jgi:deazaflavin-dependent oxidoreductase (nitroreductase family)
MRAPIWLYQARLGFLFGSRLLMVEHIGRTTGTRRYVVLEVVAHPDPHTYVVASGFGARAQWYRNVLARPDVTVSIAGHRPADATARRLDGPDNDAVLGAYVARHRRAWDALKPVLETTLGKPIGGHDTELPLIELRLR